MAKSRELIFKLTGDTKDLERAFHKANVQADAMGSRVHKSAKHAAAGLALLGGVAAGAVVEGLKKSADAAIENEKSQARLSAQLKASKLDSKAHREEIEKSTVSMSRMSGFMDKDLTDAFTSIVRSTGNVEKATKLTSIAMDVARARHMDVAKAGEMVAKVNNGNIGVLKRMGIALSPVTAAQDKLKESTKHATVEQVAAAKAADKQATAQHALGVLQGKVAGQAEAYGKTTAGAMDRLHASTDRLEVTVGNALAPTMAKGATAVAKFVDQMQSGTGTGGRFVTEMKHLGVEAENAARPIVKAGKAVGHFAAEHPEVRKLALELAAVGVAVKGIRFAGDTSGISGLLGLVGKLRKGGEGEKGVPTAGSPLITAAAIFSAAAYVGLTSRFHGMSDHAKSMYSDITKAAAGTHSTLSSTTRSVNSLAGEFEKTAAKGGPFADDLRKTAKALRGLNQPAQDAMTQISRLRKSSNLDMDSIATNVKLNTRLIARTMDKNSTQGKAALAANFNAAAAAVSASMERAGHFTKAGVAQMNRYLAQALNAEGLSMSDARRYLKTGDTTSKGRGGVPGSGKGAATGYLPGQGLHDTVPIMAAPGEAVVNRHQQGFINQAMSVAKSVGLAPYASIQELFANVRKPHYMASGGVVPPVQFQQGMGAVSTIGQGGFDLLRAADNHFLSVVSGAGKLGRMKKFANRLDGMHLPYGAAGHGGWPIASNEDCSSTVSKVLHAGGFLKSVLTTVGLPGALSSGAGNRVTVYDRALPGNAGHTIISLDGRFFGTSGSNPGGGPGWIPTPPSGYLSTLPTRLHPQGMARGGIVGKGSWFGGPHDSSDSGRTALGMTTATPGIAIYNRGTLGHYFKVTAPNGRSAVLRQTDIGPAPWTGRKIDVTYSALGMLGYTEGNFPTDKSFRAVEVSKAQGRSKAVAQRVAGRLKASGKRAKLGAVKPGSVSGQGGWDFAGDDLSPFVQSLIARQERDAAKARITGDLGLAKHVVDSEADIYQSILSSPGFSYLSDEKQTEIYGAAQTAFDQKKSFYDAGKKDLGGDTSGTTDTSATDLVASITALKDEMSAQRKLAQAVVANEGMSMLSSMADWMNGQIGGLAYTRGLTPGSGQTYRY